MTLLHFQTVLFDFDYTLADSSDGVIDCVNYAFSRLGLPLASPESIRKTIGLSLPNTLRQLAGEEHMGLADEFFRLFVGRADEIMVPQTHLFDSVPGAVESLRRQGLTLGIVSSKFRYRIEAVLEREGLRDDFSVIVGGEDVKSHKPDPAGLLWAMGKIDADSARCLFVGDSVTDAETASRANVPFVAVLTGVTSQTDFAAHPVHQVLEGVSELPGFLRNGN